jgi:uncharacterized membrane protein
MLDPVAAAAWQVGVPVLTLVILCTFVDDEDLAPLFRNDVSWLAHCLVLYLVAAAVGGLVSPAVAVAYASYFALLASKRVVKASAVGAAEQQK